MSAGAKLETQVVPFTNKGVVLKRDPAQLQQGEYAQLDNFVSNQEGALAVRFGTQQLTTSTSWNGSYLSQASRSINSIAKLHGSNPDARYVGAGQNIYRSTQSLPSSGAGMSFSLVASDVSPLTSNYPSVRWTGIPYNSGTTGQPYMYIAAPGGGGSQSMLKDTNTTPGSAGFFSTLQNWGIIPPLQPAIVTLGAVQLLPSSAETIPSTGGSPPSGYSFSDRLGSCSVSSVIGTAPGNLTIYPTVITGIIAGMLLNINGELVIVETTGVDGSGNPFFTAYCASTPSGTITSGMMATGSTYSSGSYTVDISLPSGVPSINAAFNGMPPDYSTQDVIHLAVSIDNGTSLTDMRFRVLLNSSSSDYYEQELLPSLVQGQVQTTQTGLQALPTAVTYVNLGVVGQQAISDASINQAKPATLTPAPSGAQTWTEFDLPKNQFLAVGNAGTGAFTWQNITGFQLYFVIGSGGPTIEFGSVYAAGGYGPNGVTTTSSEPLLSYDYTITYRNDNTGFESNPCQIMIAENAVSPIRQAVLVQALGTTDPQVTSIAFYRRGGAFSDGLFRHVGYVANPGTASLVTYYDTTSDSSLTYANILYQDNDAPVTSTLPVPVEGTVSSISYSSGSYGTATISLSLTSGSLSNVTVGSIATFHAGGTSSATSIGNQEQVLVTSILSSSSFTCYTQYEHYDGEQIEITAIINAPCNLGVAAFNSIFLAGDPNNPATLYKSKTGFPEAFPITELATGIADQITVGSPSNPIMAVTEFNGEIVCLNLTNIYVVEVFAGAMQAPLQTPAQRGLVSPFAWCKADNELWYLSYDGIYSWSGGAARLRSLAIDPIFKGQQIGQYYPVNLSLLTYCTMAYCDNEIRFVYPDTAGNYNYLRYHTIFDRWSRDLQFDQHNGQSPPGEVSAITAQFLEPDTGNLLIGKSMHESYLSGALASTLCLDGVGSTDNWINTGTDGSAILPAVMTAAYTLGSPSFNKQWADMMVDTDNDSAAFTIETFYNYSSTANSTDTFSVTAGSSQGRRRIFESFQNGFGMEAFAMQLQFDGSVTVPWTLYSITFNYYNLAQVQIGRAYDWDDLGYPHDKRLYQLIVEYDIPSGQTESLIMDTITGVVGAQTVTQAVQTFTLSPPSGTFTGPSHLQASFPINDLIIVKKIRLRPANASNFNFKLWGYSFQPFEKYPPDVTLFTEWNEFGNKYNKYAQQITLNVNTNDVAGTVALYVDGGSSAAAGPYSVTTTTEARQVNLTLPPNISGKMFRLVCTAGSGGKFQLFNPNDWLIWLPADRGPVTHTWDFDFLGWPFDKLARRVTFEYNTGGSSTTILADTITGINGDVITTSAFSFPLAGSGRSLQTFEFPVETFFKQIRFYPQSDNTSLMDWKYNVDKTDFPADVTLFTDWTDLGWPCDKILRSCELELNTGGVTASVQLQGDGSSLGSPFSVNTTIDNRKVILTFPSDTVAKNVRLLFTPGTGGQCQYFNSKFEAIRDVCPVTHWDSYELSLGFNGYSFIKQVWLQFICASSITVSFYVDGDTLFYQETLSSQSNRATQRFYLPAVNSSVLNKSKTHRIQIDSSSPFKFYQEESKLEFYAIGSDQRRAYQQLTMAAATAIGTGFGVMEVASGSKG